MDPRPARSSRSPTGRRSTRTRSTRPTTTTRRNRAIQDLYEPGSTFKIVTASAAIEERRDHARHDRSTAARGTSRSAAASIRDTHATACSRSPTSSSKSSNVGAIKVGMKLGAERLGGYIGRFGFGQTLGPDFRGENAGIVWNPAQLDRQRAGVGVDGLSGRRHAAADGGGRQLGRQRRRRLSSRTSSGRSSRTAIAIDVPHKVLRQTVTAETAATLTDNHGSGRRARNREGRADSRLHDRRQDRHRLETDQRPLLEVGLQRLVRRLHPVAQAGGDDPRGHRFAARRTDTRAARFRRRSSSGSPKRRCAISASDRRSTRRRRCWSRDTIRRTRPTSRLSGPTCKRATRRSSSLAAA